MLGIPMPEHDARLRLRAARERARAGFGLDPLADPAREHFAAIWGERPASGPGGSGKGGEGEGEGEGGGEFGGQGEVGGEGAEGAEGADDSEEHEGGHSGAPRRLRTAMARGRLRHAGEFDLVLFCTPPMATAQARPRPARPWPRRRRPLPTRGEG